MLFIDLKEALLSLSADDHDDFTGITESDETFFLRSEKGNQVKRRASRKRGVSKDQVVVIITQDRKSAMDISVVLQLLVL